MQRRLVKIEFSDGQWLKTSIFSVNDRMGCKSMTNISLNAIDLSNGAMRKRWMIGKLALNRTFARTVASNMGTIIVPATTDSTSREAGNLIL